MLWLITCVAMAGPMLLSGTLELILDSRLLEYLRVSRDKLTIRQRAHLLLIILIGNLDEDPAWSISKRVVSELPYDPGEKVANRKAINPSVASPGAAFFAKDPFNTSNNLAAPSQLPTSITSSSSNVSQNDAQTRVYIFAMKNKLKALLQSQNDFSTAVGLGIFFYASSFFYSIGDVQRNYGDA
ncbi:hypothetical protein ABW20_dc0102800 [Dactylellina cionopaga]|nr:hypothetical protein ABW20_dc0102800 [Dactylellina cionopaga]